MFFFMIIPLCINIYTNDDAQCDEFALDINLL